MASSINASTSGGGGVIVTSDASGNLNIQSGGSTVIAVTATGATVTGTLAATGAVSGTTGTFTGAVSGTTGTFTGAVSGTTGTFTGAVTTPLSYVRLNNANGYGSTNTVIRRFTNIVDNVGTDITYADSATLGGTFTINTNGVYSVSYTDEFSTTGLMGLSINSTQLTTAIFNINTSNILATNVSGFINYPTTCSATFYAASGAVIRGHGEGAVTGTRNNVCQFQIARVQ